MAEMIFYQQLALLDKDKHRELRLSRQQGYGFADKASTVPVTFVEFFEAARDFPIVFSQDQQGRHWPLAVLSLLDELPPGIDWQRLYVPAFIRRYPFATDESGRIVLDEKAPHFADGEGDAMLDEQGEPTELLKKTSKFLLEFDKHVRATEELCQACAGESLFKPFDAEVVVDNRRVRLQSLKVIDEEKLKGLADETATDWIRRGWMGALYAHLHSLGAVERVRQRHGEGAAAA